MLLSRRRLLWAAAAAGLGGFGLRLAQARYYDGPVSDHFDGVRFFDRHGAPPKSLTDLARWWFTSKESKWPDWAPSPYADRPPPQVHNPACRISYVGHASFLLQSAGLNILIDPVWSKRASPFSFYGPKRVNDPGIAFEDLPRIDVVLVSHAHYDHLDIPTLSRLAAVHRPRILTPLGNDTILRNEAGLRAEAFDWGQQTPLSERMAIAFVPTRHWSARSLTDRNLSLWAGFVFDQPGGKVFHVPDSGYGDGHHFRTARERYGPFRLAILPIGAYEPRWFMRDQHMNPEESLRAFLDSGAELGLGHHYGTFQLTEEAIDAPPIALAAALTAAGIDAERFRLLKPGQVWEL